MSVRPGFLDSVDLLLGSVMSNKVYMEERSGRVVLACPLLVIDPRRKGKHDDHANRQPPTPGRASVRWQPASLYARDEDCSLFAARRFHHRGMVQVEMLLVNAIQRSVSLVFKAEGLATYNRPSSEWPESTTTHPSLSGQYYRI